MLLSLVLKFWSLQATGVRGEVTAEPASKRHKTGITASDIVKAATPRSADPGSGVASPHAEMVDKNKTVENVVSPVGPPFLINKYKKYFYL